VSLPAAAGPKPVAIIDIGSNSVRLVVYSGATRAPSVLFNEKVMAGLGRGLDATGGLSREAQARALTAMSRFRLLVDRMGVVRTRVFATAAVREATNGAAFLHEVRRLGFEPLVLSGEEEGRLAGLGVLSGIPDANGVTGDLGGGSLELADIAGGAVRRRVSLPLGVLRIAAMPSKSPRALLATLCRELKKADFAAIGAGRPFYMIGGRGALWPGSTWPSQVIRSPSRTSTNWPPIARSSCSVSSWPAPSARARPTGGRTPTLPHANLLLRAVGIHAEAQQARRLRLRHPRGATLRRSRALRSAAPIR
jgi:hypothetical protein